jgi:hypothetical protein
MKYKVGDLFLDDFCKVYVLILSYFIDDTCRNSTCKIKYKVFRINESNNNYTEIFEKIIDEYQKKYNVIKST